MTDLPPELLLKAYSIGVFPMAESREDNEVFWVDPDFRAIIPLDRFHIPRSLRKTLRREPFRVSVDSAFADVIAACAQSTPDRENTWINRQIEHAFRALHEISHAHSVETWLDGDLVGGLYGVRLGGAFFGESMFSRATDASKVALVSLVARLKFGGFILLDTQFLTDHLKRFGAVEIPREDYHRRLKNALAGDADFYSLPEGGETAFVQSMTQMS